MNGAPVEFTVPGNPAAWARAEGGVTCKRFTPTKQRREAQGIKSIALAAMRGRALFDGPVEVEILAAYEWPKSWSAKKRNRPAAGWKISRPDLDNVVKLVADSLNGIVWTDDAVMARVSASKGYSSTAGLHVKVEVLA